MEVIRVADAAPVLDDLAAESRQVDELVAELAEPDWRRTTPAPGWTIAHQIAHLAWTDEKSLLAVRRPHDFGAEVATAAAQLDSYVDRGAEQGAAEPVPRLLARWRAGRGELAEALRALPEETRIPWYGPSMSAASMASARLMETWAHGQDVADTLGVLREPTARLWQIARFGVRTRDFAYQLHGADPPGEEFRVELAAPDGDTWTFGPAGVAQRITGTALDFCLLVTQRRHRVDTDLRAAGEQADAWLNIAQAFAGPPGNGREAGQFR